jgi:hypothetical protein
MKHDTLKQYVDRAQQDPEYFDQLADKPSQIIPDYELIEARILGAIAVMSPDAATAELCLSPSDDHCYQCSCGQSSFIRADNPHIVMGS